MRSSCTAAILKASMSQMGQKREFLFSGDISASDSCGHWPEGTVARLRYNRFAVWVIGDVRDDLGCSRGPDATDA
jgi:hypothetical protein